MAEIDAKVLEQLVARVPLAESVRGHTNWDMEVWATACSQQRLLTIQEMLRLEYRKVPSFEDLGWMIDKAKESGTVNPDLLRERLLAFGEEEPNAKRKTA